MSIKHISHFALMSAMALVIWSGTTGCSPDKSEKAQEPAPSVSSSDTGEITGSITLEQAKKIARAHALKQGDDVSDANANDWYNREEGDAHWHIYFYMNPYNLHVWVNRETGEIMEYYYSH